MKNLLITLFFFLSLIASGATNYYIDPSGHDDTGDGSIGNPWKTLRYAATQVTTAEDTIHVNAGTYVETLQTTLAVGVSIVGEGVTSIITSSGALDPIILLASASEGTNGAQTIRKIKMDGNLTALKAIQVTARKNVLIHHCTFVDFAETGVQFQGRVSGTGAPTTYATGNKFYNNYITNCATYSSWGRGNLYIGGQDGMLIYNDTILQEGRGAGANGYGIKCTASDGYNKNIKIYNCQITTDETLGDDAYWFFAIELWNTQGGFEIYDNTIRGVIDIAGTYSQKGASTYSVSIHDNNIGWETLQTERKYGIYIESANSGYARDILIYNNLFERLQRAITFYPHTSGNYDNIKIYYNLFSQIGMDEVGWTTGGVNAIMFSTGSSYTTWTIDSVFILNNVFYATDEDPDNLQYSAIYLWDKVGCNITNTYIRNNIAVGFDYRWLRDYSDAGTIDKLWVENNDLYDNEGSNLPGWSQTPTNYTYQNNLVGTDPEFTTPGDDYTLQATSDCIDTGIGVGLTLDYAGNVVDDNPDIGAFEYGGSPPTPPPDLPSITTDFNYRWARGASVGGSSIDDGNGTVSARGVCYSTSANPTTSDSKVSAGTGTADFDVLIRGLSPNTTYHIRAYATNEEGTVYGADYEFTTPLTSIINIR